MSKDQTIKQTEITREDHLELRALSAEATVAALRVEALERDLVVARQAFSEANHQQMVAINLIKHKYNATAIGLDGRILREEVALS